LAYVFCTKDAAIPIKTYGPELIVLGALRTSQEQHEEKFPSTKEMIVNRVTEWLPRVHSLVVGPGLGRDSLVHECVKDIIKFAKNQGLPIVLDGDGIWAVENEPSLIKGYTKATITANFNEYSRLCSKILNITPKGIPDFESQTEIENGIDSHVTTAKKLAAELGNVTLVCKGSVDIITDGKSALICSEAGGSRRCGGIGDVLAGTIGTFNAWASDKQDSAEHKNDDDASPMMIAAYGGCVLTRNSSRQCFAVHKRSMVAHDIVAHLGPSFQALFEHSKL